MKNKGGEERKGEGEKGRGERERRKGGEEGEGKRREKVEGKKKGEEVLINVNGSSCNTW